MSLFLKVAVLVLLSLTALVGLEVVQFRTIISDYEASLEEQLNLQSKKIEEKISRKLELLGKHTEILASSDEVSQAIQAVDNEVLSRRGHDFLSVCDNILFADLEGRVLARQPDEFRFGDFIATAGYFTGQTTPQTLTGTAMVDGKLSFFAIVPIRKYDDVPVGSVILAISLTQPLLTEIADSSTLQLRALAGEIVIDSNKPEARAIYAKGLIPQFGYGTGTLQFKVIQYSDERQERLVTLKNSVFLHGSLTVLFLFAICAFFLHRYLSPHARLVSLIRSYGERRSSAKSFLASLQDFRRIDDRDIRKIAEALEDMLTAMEENRKQIEDYNRDLKKTVQDLEQSLAEVKTLSGLLPICSYCKKIRDDGGYWNKLEEYFSSRADTTFSHSICPDCLKRYYPEYDDCSRTEV